MIIIIYILMNLKQSLIFERNLSIKNGETKIS